MMIRLDNLVQQGIRNNNGAYSSDNWDFINTHERLYNTLLKTQKREKKQASQSQQMQQRDTSDNN